MSYVAECFWPDLRQDVVDEAAERVRKSVAGLAGVELTGTILMPEDEVVFFLFDGDSAEAVRQACELAHVRYERVVESVRTSTEESAR
jgi:nickel-dependent lactate racemase